MLGLLVGVLDRKKVGYHQGTFVAFGPHLLAVGFDSPQMQTRPTNDVEGGEGFGSGVANKEFSFSNLK
jgi:hypothetical protein